MVIPTTTIINHTSTQHIFQYLDSPLRLSIHLWVEGSTKVYLTDQTFLKQLPKIQGEWSTMIHNNRNWSTIRFYNLRKIQLSIILHQITSSHQQEISRLDNSIHNNPNRMTLIPRSGKTSDEIHINHFPFLFGQLYLLIQTTEP